MSVNGILDKYKKIPLPVKAGIWFTICNLLQRGISILTVPIFTRLLTPDQYGVYSLYLSWLNILTIFTSLNLYYGVFNKARVAVCKLSGTILYYFIDAYNCVY